MSSPTWDEYLAEATNYLESVRQAAEVFAVPLLAPPERPSDPIPDNHREAARELSYAYDQLASEIAARMAIIESRPNTSGRSPHQESRPASYIDTNV